MALCAERIGAAEVAQRSGREIRAAQPSRIADAMPARLGFLDRVTLRLASAVRMRNGAKSAVRKEHLNSLSPSLTLYEYEASPYCRRVRETLCVLGLDAHIRPCPRETLKVDGAYSEASRHRAEVTAAGGKLSFPFLIDHTAGVALNESADIIDHLWAKYGDRVGERPAADMWLNGRRLPAPIDFAFLAAPSFLRPFGLLVAPSKAPKAPLVVHAAEPEWGCKLVCHASRAARGERAPHMPPLTVADACVGPRAPVISSAPVHPTTARERRDTSAASR